MSLKVNGHSSFMKEAREDVSMKTKEEPFLVGLEEVKMIMDHATHDEANYSWKMYQKYWEYAKAGANMKTEGGRFWETMCVLAFMFNVGKIHGIRLERAKRRAKDDIR